MTLALAAASALHAQTKACSAPEHRQFDFWIGEWEVTGPKGKLAGHNRIDQVLNGCALHESWRGAGGSSGHSYNAYDPARKVWHQTWVDDRGNLLLLEGALKDGKMVLEGMQGDTLNRITWTPVPEVGVTQVWEASKDQGRTWQTVFHGIYRPQR